ncbi:MAG: hypothetical protein ACXVCP_00720 [Bdellovibrio sp.]
MKSLFLFLSMNVAASYVLAAPVNPEDLQTSNTVPVIFESLCQENKIVSALSPGQEKVLEDCADSAKVCQEIVMPNMGNRIVKAICQ